MEGTGPWFQMTQRERVTALYLEARDDVYRYLLTLGLGPGQAQDATQEVFLRLHQAVERGQAIDNMRAWVFRVAHNHGLTERSREDAFRPFDEAFEAALQAGDESPERRLLDRERLLRLHRAVATLSPQQRQCLFLRARGLRYQEIAGAIGVGVSTVGEFLRRATDRLKKAASE